MLLFSADCIVSCFARHLQTVHPFPVIFISISTEISQSFQWHASVTKILPISMLSPPFPSRSFSPSSGRSVTPCIQFLLCILVSLAYRTCSCHEWLFIEYLSFLWVVPGDEFEYEDPVEYVHEEQGFDTSGNIARKMIITRDITSIFDC